MKKTPCRECGELCYGKECRECYSSGKHKNPSYKRSKKRYYDRHKELKGRKRKEYRYNILKHLS